MRNDGVGGDDDGGDDNGTDRRFWKEEIAGVSVDDMTPTVNQVGSLYIDEHSRLQNQR